MPARAFRAHVYVLSEEEGGRRRPFTSGYSPQFFFLTAGVNGTLTVVEGEVGDLVHPGSRCTIDVPLHAPVAIDVGLDFAIREGNRTIGAGSVTAIG